MDDIKISSDNFQEHIEEVNILNEEARGDGFEFKFKKGQLTSPQLSSGDAS